MHPVIARATRRPQSESAGSAIGAKAGLGWTPALPDELRDDYASLSTIVDPTTPVSPVNTGQIGTPAGNLDHPVGTRRRVGGGAAMPSRAGGLRSWTTDELNGAHSVIVRSAKADLAPSNPFGGTAAGLQRTPPPDQSNGEGCHAFGSVQFATPTATQVDNQ